jgi:hypothetical protein
MKRALLLVFLLAFAAWAANVKLYLKDGDFHVVREYQVQGDRVRFYSVERSEWEEIPLALVDLKRTESEAGARKAEIEKESKLMSEEEAADRALKDEVSRIPQEPGVYWVEAGQTKTLKQAQSNLRTNKGRSILKKLAPVPLVTGKATLEIDDAHTATVFTTARPEFYIQLSQIERFGIVRIEPKEKDKVRVVENVTLMPVTEEKIEEPALIPILQRELDSGLYKFWPKEPLTAGEYAVVQFTAGEVNMQVWDFAVKPQ